MATHTQHPGILPRFGLQLTAVFHLLASWRSGYLLHFRLNADGQPQQAAPSHLPAQDPEQLFSPHLMGAIRLGSAPAGVQPLPATDRKRFLAVGMRAAVVEYDSTRARLEMQWLALPGVQHAAPMYIPGHGSRCATAGTQNQARAPLANSECRACIGMLEWMRDIWRFPMAAPVLVCLLRRPQP